MNSPEAVSRHCFINHKHEVSRRSQQSNCCLVLLSHNFLRVNFFKIWSCRLVFILGSLIYDSLVKSDYLVAQIKLVNASYLWF